MHQDLSRYSRADQCATFSHQIVSVIKYNKHNVSTEYNTANLLAEIMFRNYNSLILRPHTVNQSFFLIYVYTGAALGPVLTKYLTLLKLKMAGPGLEHSDIRK